MSCMGFPGDTGGKEPACQCRRYKRCRFDPWVGKMPWRRERQLTPCILTWKILWTEEPSRLQSMESQIYVLYCKLHISSVQSLSRVQLFVTPRTAACQASLSITNSWSLLKFKSIDLVMPSNHLILCCPLSSCLQSFPASGSFPRSQFFASGGQSIGASASASLLPLNIQDWFPLGLTGHHLPWFWSPQNKVSNVSIVFPSICHEVMGPDAMILVFWMLSFKPTFSLSSFTFIKRLFSSSLSAVRVVSSAYLRLLIFLLAILIPAWWRSSLAFHMLHSAYKLNKQGDNIQPWRIPFPLWNQSVVPCPIQTVASWPAYRFLKRQFRWSWRSSLEEFSTVCCDPHSQRLWRRQ